jgi:tungstate transport system substrate-binding protein
MKYITYNVVGHAGHGKRLVHKWLSASLVVLLLTGLFGSYVSANDQIFMATTTSTENSGLLKYLLPIFEKKFNTKVNVVSVGSGKALKLGENGDVDVVLVHARSDEDKFVANGFGVNRRDVMYNDFIVVGPKEDPAGLRGMKDVVQAFKKLAEKKAKFVSRGDDSGTHKMEKSYWAAAEIKPSGGWYVSAGQGMGEVLTMSNELRAYTLSDRGTYGSYRAKVGLDIVVEGDAKMFNPYGIIAVSPTKHPDVNYKGAMDLINWIVSPEGQQAIANFKVDGQQLFYPNAK